MHWRVRASLNDRPGALAALAGCCGAEEVNILGLQIFPSPQEVVDELILHTPNRWTAHDVEQLMLQAGARDPRVQQCTAHALQDTAVQYLRAAQAVVNDPSALEPQLAQLLHASPGHASTTGDQLILDDGTTAPTRLTRPVPFTATEHARATALRQLATAAPAAPATTPDPDHRAAEATPLLRAGSVDDASLLIAMHTRCSAETIQRRYHTPIPHLSPRLAQALLTPAHGSSLVMTHGPDLVGIASIARDHDGEHEAGLLVEDRWQRHGFGTRLLHALAQQAAHQGVTSLICIIQPGNHAMLATIRRAGFNPRVRMQDGLLYATVPLTRLAKRPDLRTNTLARTGTTRLVPLLHTRRELRDIHPVADRIDHAMREGA
jgi:GNAT superfamily N-acetyltransferase